MEANTYLVLSNSASKRNLFPSIDKENESDDSIGHMSPLSSSPDRYSSPVASPAMSSPLRGTPSPLRTLNVRKSERLSRHDIWQLKNFATPSKPNKTHRGQISPKVGETQHDVLKSDLVEETPEKEQQTKVLISPFGCLVNKGNGTVRRTILETPDTSSVRKVIFTPLKDFQKRNSLSFEEESESKLGFNLSRKPETVTAISKKTFYKSFPKARTSLFSEKLPAKVPAKILTARKRSRSPSVLSVRTNYRSGSSSHFLKRRRTGEINSGVYHKIKRPKQKHVEPLKLPKITPQDRVEEYLLKKGFEDKKAHEQVMEVDHDNSSQGASVHTTPKKSDRSEKLVQSPPADPMKKFFKTNRTLAINRKATVSFVDSVKIQVSNGKFILNNSHTKSKSCDRLVHKKNIRKTDVFEDMVAEPLPESVRESVQSILESLVDETADEELHSQLSCSNMKDQVEPALPSASQTIEETLNKPSQLFEEDPSHTSNQADKNELACTPSQSIVSITASTSSLVLDDVQPSEAAHNSIDPDEGNGGKKLFPIFYKNANQDCKSRVDSPVKKTPKFPKWKQTGSDQYLIDAGQKRFGATQCKECGIVYNSGDAEDEISHYKLHNNIQSLKFMGWAEEHVVHSYSDGRVIVIQPNDSKRKLKKLREVLDVVDRELGIVDPELKHLDISKVYLFIINKSVVGCLVAHPKAEAYKMLNLGTDNIDCCSAESYPVKCGVSRIWTSKDHRKKGIATRLMDCLRLSFMYGHVLDRDEIAFSVPTSDGKAFAEKYSRTPNFLVYS